MGFFDGMKAKMAAAAAAEQAPGVVASEVNKIIATAGWQLKGGNETDLRDHPDPQAPADSKNAVKKFSYSWLNRQQQPMSVNMYLVYMSMSGLDAVMFTYINGVSVRGFKLSDFIMIQNNSPIPMNGERLNIEVNDMIGPFNPPPVQQVVMAPQPQFVTGPPQQITVFAPQPQVVGPPSTQVVMQPNTTTVYAPQPQVVTGPPPQAQQAPPQQVTIQMPEMMVMTAGPGAPPPGYQQQYRTPPPQHVAVSHTPIVQHQMPPQQTMTVNAPAPQVTMSGMPAAQCPFCGHGLPQGSGNCPGCGARFKVEGHQSSMQAHSHTQVQTGPMNAQMSQVAVQTNAPAGGVPPFCGQCGGPVDRFNRACPRCGMRY